MARFWEKREVKIDFVPFWQRLKFLFGVEFFFRCWAIAWGVFFLSSLVFLFWQRNQLPPQVPLFYSRTWGEAQLASSGLLWILPAISLVFFLVNWVCAAVLWREEEKLLPKFLVTVGFVASGFSTITLFRIVTLVT